jgi:hypothetical protein
MSSFFSSLKKSIGLGQGKEKEGSNSRDKDRVRDRERGFELFDVSFHEQKLGLGISRHDGPIPDLRGSGIQCSEAGVGSGPKSCPIVSQGREHGE